MKDVSGKKTLCMVFTALMFSMIFISAGSATIEVEEGDQAKYGSTRVRGSTTHQVYPGDSIQEAINSAQSGDTIFVHNGTYTENVVVNKTVSLIGENRLNTIIDGSGGGTVVEIAANNTNISRFTIQNGFWGISLGGSNNIVIGNNVVSNQRVGILLGGSNNTLRDNNITGSQLNLYLSTWGHCNFDIDPSNTVDGKPVYYLVNQSNEQIPQDAGYVAAVNCTNITVRNLNLQKNIHGVLFVNTTHSTIENVTVLDTPYGIFLRDSNNNTICKNTVSGFWEMQDGIWLDGSGNNVSSNTLSVEIGVGFFIEGPRNTIINNSFIECGGGIRVESENNTIYHNNFIDNTYYQARASGLNTWDNGHPSGGNYWSDHVCTGNPSFGSEPYIIDADNIDHYPFQDPDEHELVVFLDVPSTLIFGRSSLLNATVCNYGLGNETSVELFLFINGTMVNSTMIPELLAGSFYTLSNFWSPTFEAIYNITGYASSVLGENLTANNLASKMVRVSNPVVHNLDTGLGYIPIQEAIDAPETLDGHAILVDSGMYREHVIIHKSISLIGESSNNTIIDGSGTGNVISISTDNVNITGFTIQNSGSEIRDSGLYVDWTSNITIRNNVIKNNQKGIYLYNSRFIIVNDNVITDNIVGVNRGWRDNIIRNNVITNNNKGIDLSYTSYTMIEANIITYNDDGIFSGYDSERNSIVGNDILYNNHGIFMRDCQRYLVKENNIISNGGGIHLEKWQSLHTFYHNNFINNRQQVSMYDIGMGGIQGHMDWDNGTQGNYWDDYGELDTDGDGIGETPYDIDANNTDRYPLVVPIGPIPIVWDGTIYHVELKSNSTISKFQVDTSQKMISFNVTGADDKLGFCNLTLPNSLIKNVWQGNFTVLVDGEEPLIMHNWTDGTYTYIYFTYQHSEHEVTIIPESPTWSSMLLILIMLIVAKTLYRRRN